MNIQIGTLLNSSGRPLTYGEKAVGLTFTTSDGEKVNKIKALYAEIIDLLASENTVNSDTSLKGRILGRAINDVIVGTKKQVRIMRH